MRPCRSATGSHRGSWANGKRRFRWTVSAGFSVSLGVELRVARAAESSGAVQPPVYRGSPLFVSHTPSRTRQGKAGDAGVAGVGPPSSSHPEDRAHLDVSSGFSVKSQAQLQQGAFNAIPGMRAQIGLVAAVVATAVLSNERLRDALSMTLQAPALMEIPESELDAELRYQRSKRR